MGNHVAVSTIDLGNIAKENLPLVNFLPVTTKGGGKSRPAVEVRRCESNRCPTEGEFR
jgi:hypothetical protein